MSCHSPAYAMSENEQTSHDDDTLSDDNPINVREEMEDESL